MKRFKGFNPMLFAAAVIFLCVTVYSLVSNVTVYVRQRDWPVATATVIDVAENGKEYNITYQYEARGNVYTGKLHRVRLRYGFGETLAVRYDPDAPEKSVRQGAMTRRSILTQAGCRWFSACGVLPDPAGPAPKGAGGERSGPARPQDTGPKIPARRRNRQRGGDPAGRGPDLPGGCANWCGTSRKSTRPWDTRCGWSGPPRWRRRAMHQPATKPGSSPPWAGTGRFWKAARTPGSGRRPGQDHPHQRREADGFRRLWPAFPGAGGHHRRL